MGYNDFYYEFNCPDCDASLSWYPDQLWQSGKVVECSECRSTFEMGAPPRPNLPPSLYVGPEKFTRVKLTPLPPKQIVHEGHGEYHQWFGVGDCRYCPFAVAFPDSYGAPMDCGFKRPQEMQPYSVRAVVSQLAMRKDFPCKYFVASTDVDEFGNVHWEEGCMERCGGCDYRPYMHPCHLVGGWIHGEDSCAGWEYLASLCQSANERRFLHQYLRVNHDREAPMPIPQAHIEVTERIRVDFVVFVPITRFNWRWLAVEIDSREYHRDSEKDMRRDLSVQTEGYEVLRLPAEKNMLEQVRDLYKRVQDTQSWIRTKK